MIIRVHAAILDTPHSERGHFQPVNGLLHPHLADQMRFLDLAGERSDRARDELHFVVRVRIQPLVDQLVHVPQRILGKLRVKRLAMRGAGSGLDRLSFPMVFLMGIDR